MKKLILATYLLTQLVTAQNTSTAVALFSQTYPNIPIMGMGHFLNNNWQAGSAFALVEGISYYKKIQKIDHIKDTLAFPLKSTDNIIYNNSNWLRGYSPKQYADFNKRNTFRYVFNATKEIDFFESYRSYRSEETHNIPITNTSIGMLALSPFQFQYFSDLDFLLPILGASVFGSSLLNKNSNPNLLDCKSVMWFGKERKPFKFALANSLYRWFVFTSIAVMEEVVFRGIIQTELSEFVNPDFGLAASSILFGLAHYKAGKDWIYSLRATAAGFYIGWQYQKYDYDLCRVIALHFYIDFTPGFIDTFLNPVQSMNVYSISRK